MPSLFNTHLAKSDLIQQILLNEFPLKCSMNREIIYKRGKELSKKKTNELQEILKEIEHREKNELIKEILLNEFTPNCTMKIEIIHNRGKELSKKDISELQVMIENMKNSDTTKISLAKNS